MAADQDAGADGQDQAETFDETNITGDGRDIAHLDMARDVADFTSVAEDSEEDPDIAGDFDPDTVDEAELDVMMNRDDGIDEPRALRSDDADLVATDDLATADFESSRLSDEEIDELGYGTPTTAP